jgi:hypothetical protein
MRLALRHGDFLNARLHPLDQRARTLRAQRIDRRTPGRGGRWGSGLWAPPGRRRIYRRRLLVAQDDLARVRELLALQDRLNDVGVDVLVVTLDAHADRPQLEGEVLVGDPHHPRDVLDSNLSHRSFLELPSKTARLPRLTRACRKLLLLIDS